MAYDFEIHHVKKTENGRADALSRRIDYKQSSEPQPAALLRKEGDTLWSRKPQHLAFMEIQLSEERRQAVIKERHDNKLVGHKGIAKTIELITRDFTWPGLRKDVERYIGNCGRCKRTKTSRHKKFGLLQPVEVPTSVWKSITMNMIVKLPKSKETVTGTQYDSILVIIDKLTKDAYMLPWKEQATSQDLAYAQHRNIISQHGIPSKIISDTGTVFTSKFWKTLTSLMGIDAKQSTAFHPETDEQTQRSNQTLEQCLRAYVNQKQDDSVTLLLSAQFAFNNSRSENGTSPLYANYGFHPSLGKYLKQKGMAQEAITKKDDLTKLHEFLSNKLEQIRNQIMINENKNRIEGPTLEEGGKVYLLRKNIKTKRPNSKLDFTKLGPFLIKERMGQVT